MTIARSKLGINKAEDAGRKYARIGFGRCVVASLSDAVDRITRISWLDLLGNHVQPKFSNF